MAGYRIAQLAERSGFSASTLRYYEQVGLLDPPARTPAGYRIYDEAVLARLAFVDRARRMGFALGDIGELVRLWTLGDCPPVQHRMRALLDSRRREVRGQVEELTAFAAQLDEVAERLGEDEDSEQCGPGCGCEVSVPGSPARVRTLPTPARRQHTPIACSLDPSAGTDRLVEWRAIAKEARTVTHTHSGVRLQFPIDADLTAAVARLAALEVSCCPFLTMTLDMANSELELRIDAMPGGEDVARALVGPVRTS